MIGTLLNVGGIVLGGWVGLLTRRNLTPDLQQRARVGFTALTVATAAMVAWSGLTNPVSHAFKQMFIASLALCLGSLVGHLLGLQRRLSQLIRWASTPSGTGESAASPTTNFATQAIAFAANPLGLLGAILEGWTGDWRPLALKAGLDACAALGLSAAGSRTVMLSVIPMAAVQGTLNLMAATEALWFPDPALAASLQVTSGLLILVMAPVIFGWQRVPLANYLPALALAPALTAWWR